MVPRLYARTARLSSSVVDPTGAAAKVAPGVLYRLGRWAFQRPIVDVVFDRCIGDPGYFITATNYAGVAVTATEWGVMNLRDRPRVSKWRRRLPLAAYNVRHYYPLSLWREGNDPIRIPALNRASMRAGVTPPSQENQARVGEDGPNPSLVAWVRVEALGVFFSKPRSKDWARSDYKPRPCRCGHDRIAHELSIRKKRIRRSRLREHAGQCRHEDCRCRRFKPDKVAEALIP